MRAAHVLTFLALAIAGCKRPQPRPDTAHVVDAAVVATPDVVSSASTAIADAGPEVVAAGEVDGAALRAKHRARLAADTSAVTVLKGGTSRELGTRLCEAVVPVRPKDEPILIKPNLGGFEWFKDPAKSGGDDGVHGRTTDSEFVRGIVRCLKARGHTKITIAEGYAATHADWTRLTTVAGYAQMAREEKVALVAMDDDGVFDVQGEAPGKPLKVKGIETTNVPTLLLPKVLAEHLEHGLFISAPKIKAHRFGVTSMAIKGMQGTVMYSDASPAFHQKWRSHKELSAALKLLETDRDAGTSAYLDSLHVFAERMVDLLELSAPDVVLAEGAPAMGGDGFAKRWPSDEDYAIGGTNPVLVDRVGAQMLGLWDNADLAKRLGGHRTSPLIEAAASRFGLDIASPKVVGDGKDLLDVARPVHFVSMAGWSLHSDDRPPEAAPRRATEPDAGPPREAHATRTTHALAIDDEVWKTIPPVAFTTDWSGAETPIKTTARFAWSPSALFIRWELDAAGLAVDDTKPVAEERAKLYEEDCVEVFVAPSLAEKTRYYEVEVGPLGHFLDIAIDRARKTSDVAWSSRPKIVARVDRAKHEAVIAVELRPPEIVGALTSGATLGLALYRMEGKAPARRYLAWSPTRTPKPDFHVPDAFGVLRLD